MTFDKTTYTVKFESCNHTNNLETYRDRINGTQSPHVYVKVTIEQDSYIICEVYGDAYVMPVWEDEFRRVIPQCATVKCDVNIGGGNRNKL